jgi:hypothetical protein
MHPFAKCLRPCSILPTELTRYIAAGTLRRGRRVLAAAESRQLAATGHAQLMGEL